MKKHATSTITTNLSTNAKESNTTTTNTKTIISTCNKKEQKNKNDIIKNKKSEIETKIAVNDNNDDEEDNIDDSLFDLSDLFTNNDYETSTYIVPCYYPPSCTKNDNEKQDEVSITINHSKSASTDYDLTGQIIWPVSLLLSYYLSSYHGQKILRNKNVIELGGGCGLPGLVSANFANNVIITDGNDIVVDNLLKPNVKLYNDNTFRELGLHRPENLSSQKLIWGNNIDISNIVNKVHTIDVIIAADVIQWPAVIDPLLYTMKKLLSTSSYKNNPICVLGIVCRNNLTYETFFTKAKRIGFVNIRKIEYNDFLRDNGVIPIECREDYRSDECSAEIYTLELERKNDDNGTNNGDNDDLIVGKDYQYTFSLPC